MEKTEDGRRFTNFAVAAKWCNNNLVLCNNIAEIDNSVYDNARFEWMDDNGRETEVYQWYVTDCSKHDAEFLEESFGLLFTYSDMLDCFVLCVDHWGTAWDGVSCEVLNNDINDGAIEFREKARR